MLCSLGHEVYLYGARSKEEEKLENYIGSKKFHFIETHKVNDIANELGDGDNRFEIGYDWGISDWKHDFNKQKSELTLRFYNRCVEEINKNKKPDDFLLVTQGKYQKPIADKVGLFLTCESGIGYRGSYAKFRAFESAYIQNFTYGSEHPFACINGNYYDRVIPNYFDPDDMEYSDKKEDYYLYIGRMIKRKGIMTAHLTAKALNKKLIITGQGAKVINGRLVAQDFTLEPGTWEYVGFSNVEQRKKLMSKAKLTFVPTEYLECFAGTHIESMLHGTPVLTTNFGVFPGTVINGLNGYKCDTLQDFVDNA